MHQIIENSQTQHCSQQYNGAQTPNIVPIKLSYGFDYGCFANPDLENQAKSTLRSFFGFMRASFNGLLEIGRILQELYKDCLASCPDGKKVFEKWISSPDFGQSTYFAKSSMEIYNWFQSLHPKKQEFLLSSLH
jgi:hypothetical protein